MRPAEQNFAEAATPDLSDEGGVPDAWLHHQETVPNHLADFAALVERHNGVWGGCWRLEFHPEGKGRGAHRREKKEQRVRQGTAHAALVYDGPTCVDWCQFGSPEELPRIKRVYVEGWHAPPQWRITCFFVDKAYRGKGVSSAGLAGALEEIAGPGGGTVESYSEDVTDRQVSASSCTTADW